MEISITAVTRNRRFTKALVRHALALEPLKQVARHVDTSKLQFDCLQLVFMDRNEGCVKAVGCKDDRLFQVEVAIPDEKAMDFGNAQSFQAFIVQQLKVATKVCGLPQDIESQLSEATCHFKLI